MHVVSVREQPDLVQSAISYLQQSWQEVDPVIYDDCISNCVSAKQALPQWYLLRTDDDKIIGCAGLITNDFISRMDLYPWLCALYIEPEYRGRAYPKLLIDKALYDTQRAGFAHLYLSTEHTGYYERYGFEFIGMGYHPWGETSRIYQLEVSGWL